MKAPIVQHYLQLSDKMGQTIHLYNKMSDAFKVRIPHNLAKYSVDLFQEAAVLFEDGKVEEGERKKSQAHFLLDEAYAENKNNSIDNIKITSSNTSSQGDNSEGSRSLRSFKCKNSGIGTNLADFNLEIPEFAEELDS